MKIFQLTALFIIMVNLNVKALIHETFEDKVISINTENMLCPPATETWVGNTSSDWNIASNWDGNSVPTFNTNVIIPSGTANSCSISASNVVACKNLTIDNGAILTVNTDFNVGWMSVYGDISNNGTIIHTGNDYVVMFGPNHSIGGTGTFTHFCLVLDVSATVALSNSIIIYNLYLPDNASLTFSLNSYDLTVSDILNQSGKIYLGTGNLEYQGTSANHVFNESRFFEETGTFYYNGNISNQTVKSGTYYNLKISTINGNTCTLGSTGTVVVTNNLTMINPGTAGGVLNSIDDVTIGNNLFIGDTGNALTLNLANRMYRTSGNGTLTMGNVTAHAINITYASPSNLCITGFGTPTFYGTVSYISSSTQLVTGAVYNNLVFNNTVGVSLSNNVTVADAGTLTLTNGFHDLATFTLQMGIIGATTLIHSSGGLYSSSNNGCFKKYIPIGTVTSTSGNYFGLFPFAKSINTVSKFELNSTSDVTTAGFIAGVVNFNTGNIDINYVDDHDTVDVIKNGRSIQITTTTIDGGVFDVKVSFSTIISGGLASDLTLITNTSGIVGYTGTYIENLGTKSEPVVARTGISSANLSQTFVLGTYNNSISPLPVGLITFNGKKSCHNNELIWATSSEHNNDYFTVEKTIDGKIFDIVGIENGAGNSNEVLEYVLTDHEVRNIINYYRLKQTDFDGKCTYSETISINNRTDKSDKEVHSIVNLLGQEVNEFYRGLIIIEYSDGTSVKVIQ